MPQHRQSLGGNRATIHDSGVDIRPNSFLFFLAAWFYFVRITWDRPQGLLEYLGLKMGDPADSFRRMLAFPCFFAAVGLFGRAFGRW